MSTALPLLQTTPEGIQFLVDCIIFPPKVPQERENQPLRKQSLVLNLWQRAVKTYTATGVVPITADSLCRFAETTINLHPANYPDAGNIAQSLRCIQQGQGFVIYLEHQNCAILVHQDEADSMDFEVFEVATTNASVMSTASPLQRLFPGVALRVPKSFLLQEKVLSELSRTIAELASDTAPEFVPIVRKAGAKCSEIRDTISPHAVTQALVPILATYGKIISVTGTVKQVQDEVNWKDCLEPWRRSPIWLVLRVATQRWLERTLGTDLGYQHYKNLQIIVVSELCRMLSPYEDSEQFVFFARAKLGRRLNKLQQARKLYAETDNYACGILDQLNTRSEKRWKNIQLSTTRAVTRSEPAAENERFLSLCNSKERIAKSLAPFQANTNIPYAGPEPSRPRLTSDKDSKSCKHLKVVDFPTGEHDLAVALWDFEQHVRDLECEPTLQNLRALKLMFERYGAASNPLYSLNVDNASVRLLILTELWRQLDQITIVLEPLVAGLSPEIPVNFLAHLRLKHPLDMKHATLIESHVESRSKGKKIEPFSDSGMQAFACQYYDHPRFGLAMREQYESIQTDAAEKVHQKLEEWSRKKDQYQQLQREEQGLAHERASKKHCARGCRLCSIRVQIENLIIVPFEDPLPLNMSKAKAILFDLLCPESFRAWRDITWTLITDMGRPPPKVRGAEVHHKLPQYSGLSQHYNNCGGRLGLVSTAKSFSVAHYGRNRQVSTTVDSEIHLPHGPQWFLVDLRRNVTPEDYRVATPQLMWEYKGILPRGTPWDRFASALVSTQNTHNQVVAWQSICPELLTIFEFHSFNALRSGENLQWLNILVELASPSLQLAKIETHWLISQAALELGSAAHDDDFLRNAHRIFRNLHFSEKLLALLKDQVFGAKANWKEHVRMQTLLLLALRLETLSQPTFQTACQDLRHTIRDACQFWTRQLYTDLKEAQDPDDIARLGAIRISAALLCRECYTVTDSPTTTDWTAYYECGFIVANDSPASLAGGSPELRHRVVQDWTRSCELEGLAIEAGLLHSEQLNSAVDTIWSSGQVVSQWRALDAPNSRWLHAKTQASESKRSVMLHINVLTGELLVDGQPPGRPSKKYLEASEYVELFGSVKIQTLPSPVIGFELQSTFNGCLVHLGWDEGNIRICREISTGYIDVLLPRSTFESQMGTLDLPRPLLSRHVHWLRFAGSDSGTLHICPKSRAFKAPRKQDWLLNTKTRLGIRQGDQLLDPESQTVNRLSIMLGQFEDLHNLIAFSDCTNNVVVELPRFGLTFELMQNGSLFFRDLNSILLDNQDAGAFFGLQGHLVVQDVGTTHRALIVPYGNVSLRKDAQHVKVSIDAKTMKTVRFTRYIINETLQRLDCSGEARDMLLKAYLHAVTSSTLPDPLTKRRGTEEAICILSELHRQMYEPLTAELEPLLRKIANLTPQRCYYPKKNGVMQQSSWNAALSPSSQSNDFSTLVNKLLERSNKLRAFHELSTEESLSIEEESDEILVRRSQIRNLSFCAGGYATFKAKARFTALHLERDHLKSNPATDRVFEVAEMIKRWSFDGSSHDSLCSLNGIGDLGDFGQKFSGVSAPALFSHDIPSIVGSLIASVRSADKDRSQIPFTFMFPFLAYNKSRLGADRLMRILKAILYIAFSSRCQSLPPPQWRIYSDFREDKMPSYEVLYNALLKTDSEPGATMPFRTQYETDLEYSNRVEEAEITHQRALQSQTSQAAHAIKDQWPCELFTAPAALGPRIRFHIAEEALQSHVRPIWRNRQLELYVKELSKRLNASRTAPSAQLTLIIRSVETPTTHEGTRLLTTSELLEDSLSASNNTTDHIPSCEELGAAWSLKPLLTSPMSTTEQTLSDTEIEMLEEIVSKQSSSHDPTHRFFMTSLQESTAALKAYKNEIPQSGTRLSVSIDRLDESLQITTTKLEKQLAVLTAGIEQHTGFKHLSLGGLWPRTSLADFLIILGRRTRDRLSQNSQKLLRNIAKSLIRLQRLRRVQMYHQRADNVKLLGELYHEAHTWDTETHPEWLILEIEMDACIRPEQANMALEMAKPSSSSNSIYQLQMGKGKSSLIIPMLVSTLPAENQMIRVVVPKPLLSQMGAILKQRICRLLQRPLLHLPFNRASPKDSDSLATYQALHTDTMGRLGVVMSLPEHMQSFELSGIQKLLDGELDQGMHLMAIDSWLKSHSRDLLDECDHILSPRTQLIYPSGTQTQVDGGSRRWKLIAQTLRCLFLAIHEFTNQNSGEVQVETFTSASFPLIHIQSESAGTQLVEHLVESLTAIDTSPLPLSRLKADEYKIVVQCLMNGPLSTSSLAMIESRFQDTLAVNDFLLMRGILGGGILLLAIQKRWNVDYGLALERCQIAVPYVARGRPSLASEYGHPDVAITLTYLAYYYNGLKPWQLREALRKLELEQDPLLEWNDWVKYARDMPDQLAKWTAVNLGDNQQMNTLWNSLCRSLPAVNYYLDKVVFPRAAREFERKLVSSSWDIPLNPPQLTTGFSGTNDNSRLLPDSIKPAFMPEHGLANAEVLWHLLQPRNRGYECVKGESRKALPVEGLLSLVADMKFDVLLDAGALILEMENAGVAKKWLSLRRDAEAAVYFNEHGTLSVRQRNGQIDLLSKSRYASNLAGCLLYLDEEHCRGTDTKLAADARAALTIGPRQAKDQTVQAAMRMRQLGHGQSVFFLAPLPVDQSIRDFCKLDAAATVDSSHVISWSIEQSCSYIASHLSLWASQRNSFKQREKQIDVVRSAAPDTKMEDAKGVTEPEKRTLRELYGPRSQPLDLEQLNVIQNSNEDQPDNDGERISLACAEEEQERQVDQEVQEEQDREGPGEDKPAIHDLSDDVRNFVLRGVHTANNIAYAPFFHYMAQTKALRDLKIPEEAITRLKRASKLLVTRDFFRTIQVVPSSSADHAQRPVRFLIWNSEQPDYLLIISPYEANRLMSELETSSQAHLLLYEAPRTKDMLAEFEDLTFLGFPRPPPEGAISLALRLELFLFAGAIFFSWDLRKEVKRYVQYLNHCLDSNVAKRSRTDIGVRIAQLWNEWLQIRMHGLSFDLSPVGYLIEDRALNKTDAIFGL